MIINLTLVSHTYHHQIMHLSHVKIKENCIKTIGNASHVDQSETAFLDILNLVLICSSL